MNVHASWTEVGPVRHDRRNTDLSRVVQVRRL
jgi:hypothetical protein